MIEKDGDEVPNSASLPSGKDRHATVATAISVSIVDSFSNRCGGESTRRAVRIRAIEIRVFESVRSAGPRLPEHWGRRLIATGRGLVWRPLIRAPVGFARFSLQNP